MGKRDRNREEWENPANWRGPSWAAMYVAERDTRLFVPKKRPSMGATINLGHPAGRFVLLGILAVVIAVVAVAIAVDR